MKKKGAAAKRLATSRQELASDPYWYREAVIYEIPVRAYRDSNGDGIGDLPGVIEKLDYLRDLGVTAIWLLPFYPSPMRDGGYDIADYTAVHPIFGTLDDFERLLAEAHSRGIRIITELVINHTSRDHAWFERARNSPAGSRHRNFYVWSDTAAEFADARIIFKDFETSNWAWDPVAKAYYWHRFYSHQPDLNFDNPEVHEALFKVVDFWLDMGVDGLRLDAIPYLYQREGTSCENLPETHAFLKKLRAHVDAKYRDRMLLAEANQWPEDAAAYFGDGDECHMNFHFPLMPRIFMALQLEDRFPIVDILRQTPQVPESCQWATFLRNHDELTLEMVTDQDRDYMYRVYAEDPTARINLGIRRRLAPLLKSRQKIELVNALLFSLPGTPVLYYGDEIGMGDNFYLADRDGVRTPMQWSADRNAGFSRANPQKLYLPVVTDPEYHYEALNVEAQESSAHSLLWWMKRLIALAKKHRVVGTGSIEFLHPENHKILAYLRTRGVERALVVVNLSRMAQYVELELGPFEGAVPVEMFGHVRFPPIGSRPYVLTLSPYSFFWFRLEPPPEHSPSSMPPPPRRTLRVESSWRELLEPEVSPEFSAALLRYVSARRWFRGKARSVKDARIIDRIEVDKTGEQVMVLYEVEYNEGDPEVYMVPLIGLTGAEAEDRERRFGHAFVAPTELSLGEGNALSGAVFDSLATGDCVYDLIDVMADRRRPRGEHGRLVGEGSAQLRTLNDAQPRQPVRVSELEQSNSIVTLGESAALKAYRQLAPGTNPEIEIGDQLARKMRPGTVPKILGTVEYERSGSAPAVVAFVQEYVVNEGNFWNVTLDQIERLFERVLAEHASVPVAAPPASLSLRARTAPPEIVQQLNAHYLTLVRVLGKRTAEVHLALAESADPAFAPESFSSQHQRSIYQHARVSLARTFELLKRHMGRLGPRAREAAQAAIAREEAIDALLRRVVSRKLHVQRIRTHGDLHLAQVLFTGNDFVIIDFEGEPARPLNERRYKLCALRDTMGMIRSFSYVAEVALRDDRQRPQDLPTLVPWAQAWATWAGAAYLGSYLDALSGSGLVPADDPLKDVLLDFYELEKAIYELEYELNNRPDWVDIPLRGLSQILERSAQ
jgi:maltose alpha-D-glucosyltransferase / alpha-amylase